LVNLAPGRRWNLLHVAYALLVVWLQVAIGAPSSEKLPGCFGVFSIDGDCLYSLGPDEGIEIHAQFNPKDSRGYEAVIPLFVHGDLEKPHLLLELSGVGLYPKLAFDSSEVVLPPVGQGALEWCGCLRRMLATCNGLQSVFCQSFLSYRILLLNISPG
jgi:hypothetical protein